LDNWHAKPTASPDAQLAELVYELLDAHNDTARLAQEQPTELGDSLRWEAHLDYLRCLQRVARATLARAAGVSDGAPTARAPGWPSRRPPN
jgi:hypothetical protein